MQKTNKNKPKPKPKPKPNPNEKKMLREMDYKNIEGMAIGRAKFRATMARLTGTKKTPNGLVLYKGPSALDPERRHRGYCYGTWQPYEEPKDRGHAASLDST